MNVTRPPEPDPQAPDLFEAWMGMTAKEWDALGPARDEDQDREPTLF
jgi:hypothetical protein